MITTILAGCNPLKIVDVNHPEFKPESFHFLDYGTKESYAEALPMIFPVGMHRTDAENRMLNAGAKKIHKEYKKDGNKRVYFMWRGMFPALQCCQNFSIAFDENNRVYQVFVGPVKLHKNQPDWKGKSE